MLRDNKIRENKTRVLEIIAEMRNPFVMELKNREDMKQSTGKQGGTRTKYVFLYLVKFDHNGSESKTKYVV